jgi:hypothetical protein
MLALPLADQQRLLEILQRGLSHEQALAARPAEVATAPAAAPARPRAPNARRGGRRPG